MIRPGLASVEGFDQNPSLDVRHRHMQQMGQRRRDVPAGDRPKRAPAPDPRARRQEERGIVRVGREIDYGPGTATTHALNSDVLSLGSVAVAVIDSPPSVAPDKVREKATSPAASVVTRKPPRNRSPSP